ncbi:hypothetical protein V1514DRAFT_331002 [Lipomyces japonicus]|uniref:uncharacterized protein n=1 Tax=Lipomyces japonicus TaxID=56871 RepID=UPI0034CEB15D
MAAPTLDIPTKLPFFCKALYSWSGEQERDLGFVEGDLIECLNLGDGQWWVGRLKRNYKVMGYFPSNFVTILQPEKTKQAESENRQYERPQSVNFPSYNDNTDFKFDDEFDEYEAQDAPPMPPPHKVLYRSSTSHSIRHNEPEHAQLRNDSAELESIDGAMNDIFNSLEKMQVAEQPARSVTSLSKRSSWYNKDSSILRKLSLNRAKSSMALRNEKQEDTVYYDYDGRHETISLQSRRSLLRNRSLGRTNTVKTTSTISNGAFSTTSQSTAPTTISDMSATSAGSLARRKAMSRMSTKNEDAENVAPVTLPTGIRSGHLQILQPKSSLAALKLKKSGFFNKLKQLGGTGLTTKLTKSTTSSTDSNSFSGNGSKDFQIQRTMSYSKAVATKISAPTRDAEFPQEQSTQWIQGRVNVSRAKSMSQNEKNARRRKQELEGLIVFNPLEVLHRKVEGDEGYDGRVVDVGMDVTKFHFSTLDKAVRVLSVPSLSTLSSFTVTILCRPYKSDLQRLRAIFVFCTERIIWHHAAIEENDFDDPIHDENKIFRSRKASADEMAFLVKAMCGMLQIPCEIVKGYLKAPGEIVESQSSKVNHAWNTAIVDGEWRVIDASLASPTHPRREQYVKGSNNIGEDFYFLAKPSEVIFTHVPRYRAQQHIVPTLPRNIVLEFPSICPGMFQNQIYLSEFDTSLLRMTDQEICQIEVQAPPEIDVLAEVEVRGYCVDADGDVFESGDVTRTRTLAQPYWVHGRRLFRIKAVLPPGEHAGVLKVYAGRRGTVHSIRDNPYAPAVAFPVTHSGTGNDTPFSFVTRQPTPQAQRFDVYVVEPQCEELVYGNVFMFQIREYANNVESMVFTPGRTAKMAIEAPSGKIIRMNSQQAEELSWEALIKCNERGPWRGLVMADRSATWCVFAEWKCL